MPRLRTGRVRTMFAYRQGFTNVNNSIWIVAVALALLGSPSGRAASPVLEEATNLSGTVMFMESHAPGMILIAIRGDDEIIRGFGETTSGNNQEPNGDSLFRLNSITKVFTTEVLVTLVAESKLRLTDPLQRYAGEVRVPDFAGQPITLLDLATHSGATPREMGESPAGAGQRDWPTRADRWKWIATYKLPWAPGSIANYSNVGFDLLADAIETADGKPYPDVLRERVTGPQGMKDTTFTPTVEQCKRLMGGIGLGASTTCEDTHATDGSGGLYSTGHDMAIWLRHNLTRNNTLEMSHAVYLQRQSLSAAIGFDEGAPMSGLALGWVYLAGDSAQPALLTKSGGGVGFMSYMAFAPGRNVGVLVIVNRTDFGIFAPLVGAVNSLIGALTTR
jgi:D-alanyl-D-alanine-carboxypeptidase/D-alanyl-D-alanine-endopeptidase